MSTIKVRSQAFIAGGEIPRIHTWEGNVLFRPWEWLRLQTSFSYSYVLDKAEFVYQGANSVAQNLAELGVYAWETEARVQWDEQLYAYFNFALVGGQRNLRDTGYRARLVGANLELYPPAILNAGVGYRFREIPLRLTAEARYISDRRASDSNIVVAS